MKAAESISECKHAIGKGFLMRSRESQTVKLSMPNKIVSQSPPWRVSVTYLLGALKRKLHLRVSELPIADLGAGVCFVNRYGGH